MQLRTTFSTALLCIGALALCTACEQKQSDTTNSGTNTSGNGAAPEIVLTAINTTCPYSGKPIDPSMVVSHDSVNVGFCCKGCKAKFEMLDHDGQHQIVAKIQADLALPSPVAPDGEAPIIATPAETGG